MMATDVAEEQNTPRLGMVPELQAAMQQSARMMQLFVATSELHAAPDCARVQQAIAEIAVNLVGAEHFVILVRNGKSPQYDVVLAEGVDADSCFAQPTYSGGEPSVDGALECAQVRVESQDRSGILAVVPFVLAGEVVGALILVKLLSHKPSLLDDDLSLFDVLSAHAAMALANAQQARSLAKTTEQLRDEIAQRERMEMELRHAQKLGVVGQLAAGIAHEINTPIQYIGDNTHFLRTAFDSYTALLEAYNDLLASAKQAEAFSEQIAVVEGAFEDADIEYFSVHVPRAVESTLEGVNRVSKIVLAMKDFSHPGSEEKEPVDINRALETTITVAKNEWKYVAEMETEFDPNLPTVLALGGALNQVFLNVLVNAAHAINDVVGDGPSGKGTIRISTRCEGSWVEARISDTGTGIPEEVKDRIFDRFFTTKEAGKGTGQGLAIVRSVVVEKHNGQLDVETECGKGTTFVIRLPIEEHKAVA